MGCYDEASLSNLQSLLKNDFKGFAEGNVAGCANKPLGKETVAELVSETMLCDPHNLGVLMRDHTQLDWRPLLGSLKGVKILNCIGGDGKIFPVEGCKEISRLVKESKSVVFQGCNHWLYLEEPDKFNDLVYLFIRSGNLDSLPESIS